MQAGEPRTCNTSHDYMMAVETGFITAETIDNSSNEKLKNYGELIAANNEASY